MRVLLDSNVILDLLLARAPWAAIAGMIWQAHLDGNIFGYVSASSLTDIYYIVRRNADVAAARRAVRACLDTLGIVPIDGALLNTAFSLSGRDFEDDVQIACALTEGLNAIITRDPRGFAESPIEILTPDELVRRLGIRPQVATEDQPRQTVAEERPLDSN